MPVNIIKEYIKIVDSIYGVYLDGCQGFSAAKSLFERSQQSTLENNKLKAARDTNGSTRYNTTINEFDDSCMIFTRGKKEDNDYRVLHYCPTQKEYKNRNSHNGENYKFMGNMALISIYEYWESACRNKLAAYHKVEQKQVESDIFGDIRILRHSIIHNKGISLPEINKCSVFTWYQPKDVIFIDGDKIEDIVSSIKANQKNLYKVKMA